MTTAVRPGRSKISLNGMSQGSLVRLLKALRNTSTRAAVAPGTGGNTLAHGAVDVRINGRIFNKASVAAGALTGQGLVNLTANQYCKVRIEVYISGGTEASPTLGLRYIQGGIANSQENATIPGRLPGGTTIGWLEVGSAGVFTWGTTSLVAANCYDGDPDLMDTILEP